MKQITIEGKSLTYQLSGAGRPVILLFNGHHTPLHTWDRLYPEIEALGTVLRYDRLGMGGSDKPDAPQDGDTIIGRLLAMVSNLALPPPYILVGHSLGGLYVNLFARRCPEQTGGVVFVEAGHPDEAALGQDKSTRLIRIVEKINTLFGASYKRDPNSEYNAVATTVEQIKGAGVFPEVPLSVVTGVQRMPLVPKRHFEVHQQKQKALVALSSRAQHIEARRSGHLPQVSEPQLVLEAIQATIESARGST